MEPSKPSKAHDGYQPWSQPQYNVRISIFGLCHVTGRHYDRCHFCGLYDLAAFGLGHSSFRFGERYVKYLFCHFFCKEKNHKLTSVLNYLYSNVTSIKVQSSKNKNLHLLEFRTKIFYILATKGT